MGKTTSAAAPARRWLGASVLALALASGAGPVQAAALRISGLRAGEPLQAAQVQPQLDGRRMLLPLGEAGALRIQPWPPGLPTRLAPQQLRAELRWLPAGPVTRLEFTRVGEGDAWLVLGSGTRPGQGLEGGWRLQLAQGRWWAAQAHVRVALPTPGEPPVLLRAHGAPWCLYLLDARVPPSPQAGALREQEPQADWAMQRLEGDGSTCAAAPGASDTSSSIR